jgi:hypothetical protein
MVFVRDIFFHRKKHAGHIMCRIRVLSFITYDFHGEITTMTMLSDIFPVNVCEMLPIGIRFLRPEKTYEVTLQTESKTLCANGISLDQALERLVVLLQNNLKEDIYLVPDPQWIMAWETLLARGYHP